MKNSNNLKVENFDSFRKSLSQLMLLFFFIVGITPLILIYFLAPNKFSIMFKMPSVFFLIIPLSSLLILILSFFVKSENGITRMELKHNHFFMTVYDKDKIKHNLSIPTEEIQNVKILVTQIFVYADPKNINPYLIVAADRDINHCIHAKTDQDATLIYQLVINLKNGKSFNIIDEIPALQLGLKYFLIPRLLPNFSYKVNDIYGPETDVIKQQINSYALCGKGLGVIGYIKAYLTSKEINLGSKIILLLPIFVIIFLVIACLYLGYLFIIGFLS